MSERSSHSVPHSAERTRREACARAAGPSGTSHAPDHRRTSLPTEQARVPGRLGWRLVRAAAAAGAIAAAYMLFEAQWIECKEKTLRVPGLPHAWSGIKVLHLSDVHAGDFGISLVGLRKAVDWAVPLQPDLVFLTGDILGEPTGSAQSLAELSRLSPTLGCYAVTGNHEYGLGKGPLARARDSAGLWTGAEVTVLKDRCVRLPARDGSSLVLCGADYVTGGFGLADPFARPGDFRILLIHDPPRVDDILKNSFSLAFAGHTHGGQLRVPAPSGLVPLADQGREFLGGVYPWGDGLLVVSRGVGTSFLPFRLLTRPEATLWRLV